MTYPFNDITEAFGRMGKAALEPATLAGDRLISQSEAIARANQAQAIGAMRAWQEAFPATVNAQSPKAACEALDQVGGKLSALGQSYRDELTRVGNQQLGAVAAVADQAMTAGATVFSESLDLAAGLLESTLSATTGKATEEQQSAA